MSEEDYKIAYDNVMIANKMLEQENKQLKEDKKKAIEYIKKVFPTDFCEMEYESAIKLLEILGDKDNE